MIEAVFFDVDETLVDFDSAARRAHVEVFGNDDDYAAWGELTSQFWARFNSGEVDFAAMRQARMLPYLTHRGCAADANAAAVVEARRWAAVEQAFECFGDVDACLGALRRRDLVLGVITNNDSDHQRRKLAAVGLADAFDVVVISGEVGLAKPDPAIFRLACDRAGVSPSAAVHVGDLLEVDALAAASAGLRGVWLDRAAAATPKPATVARMHTLAELPAWVADAPATSGTL